MCWNDNYHRNEKKYSTKAGSSSAGINRNIEFLEAHASSLLMIAAPAGDSGTSYDSNL